MKMFLSHGYILELPAELIKDTLMVRPLSKKFWAGAQTSWGMQPADKSHCSLRCSFHEGFFCLFVSLFLDDTYFLYEQLP